MRSRGFWVGFALACPLLIASCQDRDVVEPHGPAATAAACIQTYNGATQEVISNNVVANCGRYGIQVSADPAIGPNDYTTVDNNIVVNVNGPGIYESTFGSIGTNNVYYNNIVYNNSPNISLVNGRQSGTITLTAAQFGVLFLNYTGDGNGDYYLQGGAAAIDAGTTNCAAGVSTCVPSIDVDSMPRPQRAAYDIGVYESPQNHYVSSSGNDASHCTVHRTVARIRTRAIESSAMSSTTSARGGRSTKPTASTSPVRAILRRTISLRALLQPAFKLTTVLPGRLSPTT